MTFNIHSGLEGLDKVAEVIRATGPDIVALQEVDIGSLRSKGQDQLAVLAERTGYRYSAHFRTTTLYGGGYGPALLSRYPLEKVEQHALPVEPGMEPRIVAHAIVNVNGREVSVYATHLTKRPFNGELRMRQSVAILELMERDPRPKLLMGDMNDVPTSRPMRLLKRELMDVFALRGQGRDTTYRMPAFLPEARIDYVLACDHFLPKSSRVLRSDASDHYPVVADLTLLEPVETPTAQVARRPESLAPAMASSGGH
ncbi:endonuclease/exonuclease/phosphatase family protein [Archangium sp.]|uniref:endonuclease/exonuclease/phosphatase family protein n=1 Tax=Archangium sp. TaxID=1872627 RepID=UPI00286B443E|nr:endonuclease/exonuclease/phosphatase family protein [Archangium sp.]